jgi:hypothetical protein
MLLFAKEGLEVTVILAEEGEEETLESSVKEAVLDDMLASEHDAVAIASSTPLFDVTNDPVKLLILDSAAVN